MSLSTDNWDLHRRAERDRQRHNDKVKEVIKKNLGDIISQQDIITADQGKIVKIPVRGLELPRIRFDNDERERIGQGGGGSKPGDIIARAPSDEQGQGTGKQAGQEAGVDFYEAELTLEELTALVFEDLHLPNLEERGVKQIMSEHADFNSISKRGITSNLDRKRTLLEAYKRNAREGKPGWEIKAEDRRYKTWEMVTEPQRNAVIFAMRDVSGSMGEFEAYICRSFYFWMLRFLRKKYASAEIVFITCHTEAKEVDEHSFFSLGDSGGTKMSEAYKLAMKIIDKRYNPREWNIYPFLFSDGYNWGDQECVELMKKMVEICNQVGYGEIANDIWSQPSSFAPLGQAYEEAFKNESRVCLVKINNKEDVWPALQKFFSKHPELQTA
jgi:sporulation protein YhbH